MTKPPYGQPCNGCGLCCLSEQCALSFALFGQSDRCPALLNNERGFGCGLIVDTAAHVPDLPAWSGPALSEAFGLMLGSGLGCDAQDQGETVSVADRLRMRAQAVEALESASPEARTLVQYFTQPDADEFTSAESAA